jgi:hypothetical protein
VAIISEIKNSDFDVGKTLNTFSDNAGAEITTDQVKRIILKKSRRSIKESSLLFLKKNK